MSESILAAIVTGILALPASWFAWHTANRKSNNDSRAQLDAQMQAWMDRQQKTMDEQAKQLEEQAASMARLKAEVDSLRAEVSAARRVESRLRSIIRTLVDLLALHEPDAVTEIRQQNRDLQL